MNEQDEWLSPLAQVTEPSAAHLSCPDCHNDSLNIRYVVGPSTRVGYVLFWCSSCLHGITVSRARAPEGVEVWPLDGPTSAEGTLISFAIDVLKCRGHGARPGGTTTLKRRPPSPLHARGSRHMQG